MKYIKDFHEGDRINDTYLCKHKQSAVTKTGKAYDNVILQDKTGAVDAKIWEPNSAGIEDFEALDYVDITGEVTVFNGTIQLNIKRVRKCSEGEYDPREYLPVSQYPIDEMYTKLLSLVDSIENPYLNKLLNKFFREDEEFIKKFKNSSAAKSVHHGFVGGLLEHTLSVTSLCNYYCKHYPILKRDLLLSAAMLHDIAKTRELSAFPVNDYTDEGNFLGHIVMGVEMVGEKIKEIDGFPTLLESEIKHCIVSHHGEYEFGSPKKPAIIEAVALNYADDIDAKMETFKEMLEGTTETGWLGFNRLFDSNVRGTVL
ncbi:MAG: HD domain-containing protein [Lachnospiraceae bacterium]|nr:HD domain-containing protein [Lachnospiraceae bacterium]MBR5944423.1 HD domain-containing protein [Lachnospiraceae bacterium]